MTVRIFINYLPGRVWRKSERALAIQEKNKGEIQEVKEGQGEETQSSSVFEPLPVKHNQAETVGGAAKQEEQGNS